MDSHGSTRTDFSKQSIRAVLADAINDPRFWYFYLLFLKSCFNKTMKDSVYNIKIRKF